MRNNPVFQSVRPSLGMDVLSPLLEHLHFNARLVFEGGLCGPWAISDEGGIGRTTFHLVTKGGVWLHGLSGEPPRQLVAGDLVFFPRDPGCMLSDSFHVSKVQRAPKTIDWSIAETALICGYFSFGTHSPIWLLEQIPSYVLIEGEKANALRTVVELLIQESSGNEPGRYAIMERLADGLFMYVLRHCLQASIVQSGLLAGLRDKALRQALLAIYREPAKHWDLWVFTRICG